MTYEQQKRILNLVVATGLIFLFLPIWLIVPLAIFLDSGLPILFKHRRLGMGGREFDIYKFRSMVVNADDILHHKDAQLLAQFKNGDWKMKNDPRVTRIGKVLRGLTIDEFPQLINVLKGDMNLVGPRAYMKKELDEQTKKYPATKQFVPIILSVKPGITGVWQTSGRNEIPFVKRAEMDAFYVKHQNIWNDIAILLKTPRAMLSKW